MKVNEIYDPEDRQATLKRAMDQLQRQYAQPSPEVLAARKAKQEASRKASDEHNARRKRVEAALEPIAQKYRGDQFEDFKREAEALVPPEELKTVDLNFVFSYYNPDKQEENRKSWEDYGRRRAEGDPSIVGIGPGGGRNWTGD